MSSIHHLWNNEPFDDDGYLFGRKSSFVGEPINDEMINQAQNKLGYRLPKDYLELLNSQNGGLIHHKLFITDEPNSLYGDYLYITNILGIDKHCKNSIYITQILTQCGFDNMGIYFCDLNTDHDWLVMDYRECGQDGEPQISHICVDGGVPEIQIIAKDFNGFMQGLKNADEFEYDEDNDIYLVHK